jgi:hypothetical protein
VAQFSGGIPLLVQPYFLHVIVPLIVVLLGVFLKIVTRNDQHAAFKKEDLAVGLDISITTLIIFITDSVYRATSLTSSHQQITHQAQDKIVAVPWILLAFVIGIWSVSTLVRKMGWQNDSELRPFWGIIIPDIFGIGTLIFVVNWIGN